MRYIEAPDEFEPDGTPSLFLAGGISGCGDWQRLVAQFKYFEVIPRK